MLLEYQDKRRAAIWEHSQLSWRAGSAGELASELSWRAGELTQLASLFSWGPGIYYGSWFCGLDTA